MFMVAGESMWLQGGLLSYRLEHFYCLLPPRSSVLKEVILRKALTNSEVSQDLRTDVTDVLTAISK